MKVGSKLGPYEIIERIGVGAMGDVYRARDDRRDRDVALKILAPEIAADQDRMRNLRREVEALAAMRHPYVIEVHAVESSGDLQFLVMEFLKGWRLDDLIPKKGYSITRFFEIALPVTDALIAIHEAGLVHRDLKPANVMLTTDGIVKVLGFGLRQVLSGRKRSAATGSGPEFSREEMESGVPVYLAPEQIRGEPADESAEVYALGTVFYEMLSGQRLFAGTAPAHLAAAILHDAPAPLRDVRPDLSEPLRRLVENCLEKSAARRPGSVARLRLMLLETKRSLEIPGAMEGPSIAVVPFTDLSPGRDQDYFCDGITEELIGNLSRLPNLRVASKEVVFQFKDSSLNSREIGRRLGVSRILEGTTRKAGHGLRIAVELTGLPEGRSIWSAEYDQGVEDVFAIQDAIVSALQTVLIPEDAPAHQPPPTTSVQAYEYYLRGRKFYYQYRKRGIELALQMFSTAISHDPDYALAYAGIADCCCYLYLYAEGRRQRLEQAEEASAKALAINANLAAVQASRGLVLSVAGRHDEADEAFETALRLDPRLFEAHYYYARDCFAQGRIEDAARLFERASEVNPHDYQAPLIIAQVYERLDREAEAEAARRRGVRIAENQIKLHPGDVRARYMGANGLAALGESERALEWASLAQVIEPKDPMVLYNVGCIYSLCGKTDEAIECLEKAARAGLAQKGWYENDSNLDPLRTHGRFQALMKWLDQSGAT